MYKIVRKQGDNLISPIITTGEYSMRYIPDQWVYAKIGKLFVFDSVIAARMFMLENALTSNLYELWKCDALEATKCENISSRIDDVGIFNFWQYAWIDRAGIIPVGTYECRAVKLIAQVYDWRSTYETW